MFLRRQQGLTRICFSNLSECQGVVHGIFLRQQGPGQDGDDADFNIGLGHGANRQTVLANRRAIAGTLGVSDLVFLHQVHGTQVAVIRDAQTARSAAAAAPKADAAVCAAHQTALALQTADCQAVLLYDPVGRTVAGIHSGWRGSVSDVIGACIRTMQQQFNTDPAHLIAGVGPSLGPCCAEFIHYKREIPPRFWKYRDRSSRFDFWQISKDQMQAAGVPEKNIELSGICTRCNPHLFFSYRRNRTSGRFAAVIGLQNPARKQGNENDPS